MGRYILSFLKSEHIKLRAYYPNLTLSIYIAAETRSIDLQLSLEIFSEVEIGVANNLIDACKNEK